MLVKSQKCCAECGNVICGRVDKKFCSDQCRSSYHNRINSDVTNYVRNINLALKRNRRILSELNPTGKAKVSRENLLAKGFDFQHCTSICTTSDGSRYTYCYEHGYHALENGFYLLVVKKNLHEPTVWPLPQSIGRATRSHYDGTKKVTKTTKKSVITLPVSQKSVYTKRKVR